MEEGMKLRYNYIKRMVLRLRGRKGTSTYDDLVLRFGTLQEVSDSVVTTEEIIIQ